MSTSTENTGLLIGVTIAGIALLISGVIVDQQLMTAIGGAALGASLSGWVSKNDILRIEDRVLSTLKGTLINRFTSNEDKVKNFRKEWHVFHVTEINKEKVWRHHVCDFRQKSSVGALQSQVLTKDKHGDEVTYLVEGGLRDQRLVIFEKAEGSDEPTAVFIFPLFSESCLTIHYGIGTIKTWDGDNALVPVIISRGTLFEITTTDTVEEEKAKKLDKSWKEEFYRLHHVLPRIIA